MEVRRAALPPACWLPRIGLHLLRLLMGLLVIKA
jgi:hypothetical protein